MSFSTQEVVLDLRELEPPEPFVQSLAALEQLPSGSFLHLVHHRAPVMLYPELAPRGFTSETREDSNGLFHVMIWREAESDAADAALQRMDQVAAGD